MYKGHRDKTEGGGIRGGRWGWQGWRGVVEGKWRQLYLNNNKIKVKKKSKKKYIKPMSL